MPFLTPCRSGKTAKPQRSSQPRKKLLPTIRSPRMLRARAGTEVANQTSVKANAICSIRIVIRMKAFFIRSHLRKSHPRRRTTTKPTVLPATRVPLPDEELLDYEPGEEELILETDQADEDIETIMDSLCQAAAPPQKSSMKKPEDAVKSPGAARGRKKITFDHDPKPITAAARRKLDTSGDRAQDKPKEPPRKRQRNAPKQDKGPPLNLDNLSAEEYKRLEQFVLARQSKDEKPPASKKK
jgi:hypothetical protein